IAETPKLVMTLATMVPTFFIRLKPTSSMAKPACMNITKTAATITHTVSAPTPAARVAVWSSARTGRGSTANSAATASALNSLLLLMIRQRKYVMQAVLHAAQPKEHRSGLGETHVSPPLDMCEGHDNGALFFVGSTRIEAFVGRV